MRAMILRGKKRGQTVEISQWCNDWFSVDDDVQIYSPGALAFTAEGMDEIRKHKNNGTLFGEFEVCVAPSWTANYLFKFKKIPWKKHTR